MADNDGDSHMDSPPELSDTEINTGSLLSPPESQSQNTTNMPAGANSNGKRPLNTISNGDSDLLTTENKGKTRSTGTAAQDFPPRTHAPSGYTWSRHEDEPGYAWSNKKALDERQRAWEGLVHKELMVRMKYGDPIEVAERETAMRNSLKQR